MEAVRKQLGGRGAKNADSTSTPDARSTLRWELEVGGWELTRAQYSLSPVEHRDVVFAGGLVLIHAAVGCGEQRFVGLAILREDRSADAHAETQAASRPRFEDD